jgi:plasmid stabilization system protein ParE
MAFTAIVTKRASRDFDSILYYIQDKFGTQAVIDFRDLVFESVDLIESFPHIGSLEFAHKNIRGLVVHRRLKVFYRVKNNRILILRLFDTRQHPDVKF